MIDIQKKTTVLWMLAVFMLINVGVSTYIQIEKEALLRGESNDTCFASSTEGNCADVQLSEYGKIFGVSVSAWGIIAFSFMTILFGSLAYSLKNRQPITSEEDLRTTIKFAGLALAFASIGATYFIYLQFFVIQAICKYCMVIDSLTLISAAIFFTTFKKGLNLEQL